MVRRPPRSDRNNTLFPITTRVRSEPAEDVATSNHQAQLKSALLRQPDLVGHARHGRRIDAELLLAHQGFAGQFQQYAFEWPRRHVIVRLPPGPAGTLDRKRTRLNPSHQSANRMPSSILKKKQ